MSYEERVTMACVARIPWQAKELSVGQLAGRCGVAVSALHFYESMGLITSWRSGGNQRRYHRDTVRRVAFIRVAQRVGIPLRSIHEALQQLPEERTPTRADWARLSDSWHSDLEARIADLEQLRDNLAGCIGCGCLSMNTCLLANPHDELGDQGTGARRMRRPGQTSGETVDEPQCDD